MDQIGGISGARPLLSAGPAASPAAAPPALQGGAEDQVSLSPAALKFTELGTTQAIGRHMTCGDYNL